MFDGQRLAELREEAKLTQADLAKELNVSRDMISKYETGIHVPSDEIKLTIAKRFNISLDYLMCLTDELSSYNRTSKVVIPIDFSDADLSKVIEYVKVLHFYRKNKKSNQ